MIRQWAIKYCGFIEDDCRHGSTFPPYYAADTTNRDAHAPQVRPTPPSPARTGMLRWAIAICGVVGVGFCNHALEKLVARGTSLGAAHRGLPRACGNSLRLQCYPEPKLQRPPFFSPDGPWVGFLSNGLPKKISVQGGAPVTLRDAPFGWARLGAAVRHCTRTPQSGKAMARTGLRMMPTFPLPPLKFRTAGFPRYGFKAGLSDGAFPAGWFAIVLRALCCHRQFPALCQRWMRLRAPPCERITRSTPGALTPVRVMLSRSIVT
jgi:hypothetical protein